MGTRATSSPSIRQRAAPLSLRRWCHTEWRPSRGPPAPGTDGSAAAGHLPHKAAHRISELNLFLYLRISGVSLCGLVLVGFTLTTEPFRVGSCLMASGLIPSQENPTATQDMGERSSLCTHTCTHTPRLDPAPRHDTQGHVHIPQLTPSRRYCASSTHGKGRRTVPLTSQTALPPGLACDTPVPCWAIRNSAKGPCPGVGSFLS